MLMIVITEQFIAGICNANKRPIETQDNEIAANKRLNQGDINV